ncbi:hypothetical protein QTP88_027654 [Uroleucon formosanum]
MLNIIAVQNNISSEVENHRSSSAELMHQIFSELRNGSTFKITLESHVSFTDPASRRCYQIIISSVPNTVQVAPADGVLDVGLPSSSTTQTASADGEFDVGLPSTFMT